MTFIMVSKTDIYSLREYSKHLKNLPAEDKTSRFCYPAQDYVIDQLMLRIAYHYDEHHLWCASVDEKNVGWGHLAYNEDGSMELAVSVDRDHQGKGIADRLMTEMLSWAKFHQISEIYMHCIEDNRVIQHLAAKHGLKTKERQVGERTAAIELPEPSFFEANTQYWKEQAEIFSEFGKLRQRLTKLWTLQLQPK